jgi:hypothetical protein
MGIDKWIFIITAFLIFDTYHDGKYSSKLLSGKKYYRMALYGFIGVSLYMFLKKHPNESKTLLSNASELVKFLPIDHGAGDLLSPIFDFTNVNNKLERFTNQAGYAVTPQFKRMVGSGHTNNRSVSESKKKYIASQQQWKCSYCGEQLDYTYEVDHKIELQDGGSNHITNLAACCRKCHAKKGFMNKL